MYSSDLTDAQCARLEPLLRQERGQRQAAGRTPRPLWRRMKRRAAIEPSIGHLKNEHRLEQNRLRSTYGDALNALLAAAAMNFHKLLGALGLYFLRAC